MKNQSTKETYERMKRYATAHVPDNYDMRYIELLALYEEPELFDVISLSFRFGFEKGSRYTKKMLSAK